MRKLLGFMAFGALVICTTAAPVQAAVLAFTGTLSTAVGTFPAVTATGSGTGTSLGGPGTGANTGAGVFTIDTGAVISPPLLGLIAGFGICAPGLPGGTALTIPSANAACPTGKAAQSGALNFNGTHGTGALIGSAYLTSTAFTTAAEIPLSNVGAGGSTTFTVLGLITGTITGNPWQLGTVTISGAAQNVTTTLTGVGFDNRASNGTGTLQLVTTTLVQLSGGQGNIPSVATLTLTFVPEPGTLLLLGSGIAGLVVLGRRRMSH